MKLEDSVAVVTGASRGVGRATAVVLARAGVHVVCTARSTASAPSKMPGTIEETVRQVQALGRRALAVRCDVSQEDQVEALAQRTLTEFGRIDILINNAAANYWAPFADMPMKRWDLVLNVNLRGAVLCTKAFLPHMVRQRSGRIVNVSSGAAVDPEIAASYTMLAYAVSKAGLEMFTGGLGLELRPHQIAVNALRIETYVATEGAVMFNPDVDCSTWEKPETAGEYIRWLATREPSFTGKVMTMAQIREALGRNA
jgi:citronellol/citronellal dehydrogenase